MKEPSTATERLVAIVDRPMGEFRRALAADLDARNIQRIRRRAQWNASVHAASVKWREAFGYKMAPVVDRHLIQREAREMVALVMKARLLIMTAPLFAITDSIDRSMLILSIFASPSGAGPERYAPKPDAANRISCK